MGIECIYLFKYSLYPVPIVTTMKIPIVILNGFLGSGKTTLFINLLAQSKKKDITVCAIVNDMSELDVDGELIGNTEIVENDSNILESINSCVLSSKKGIQKLDQSINKLLSNHFQTNTSSCLIP